MEFDDLPQIGQPGSAASFQLERLREWGLSDLADKCTSREKASLVHHCAMKVCNIWIDIQYSETFTPHTLKF